MSEKGDGTVGGVWKGVVLVLLTIVTLLLLCIVYQGLKGENPLTKVKESIGFSTETEVAIPTVQERLNEFNAEVEDTKAYDTYLSLPIVIVEGILNKLGPDADYRAIVNEYYTNRSYWISTQVSNQIKPVLTGPDAKNVERVEVKTVLKEETPPGNEVSLTPADSIK